MFLNDNGLYINKMGVEIFFLESFNAFVMNYGLRNIILIFRKKNVFYFLKYIFYKRLDLKQELSFYQIMSRSKSEN